MTWDKWAMLGGACLFVFVAYPLTEAAGSEYVTSFTDSRRYERVGCITGLLAFALIVVGVVHLAYQWIFR